MSAEPLQSRHGGWLRESVTAPIERLKGALSDGEDGGHGEFLQQATEQLSRLVGVERCTLLVLDDERLYHGGIVGLPARYTDRMNGLAISPDRSGTCGAAAALGEPVVTHDLYADSRWRTLRELADVAGVRSCWSVPVATPEGETLGTFAAYEAEPGAPRPELIELARAHASLVAIGLERLRHKSSRSDGYEAVVVALSSALDARDEYTGAHSVATADLAVELGKRLGILAEELQKLERTAILHDIGKLGIPTEILRAARPLTAGERRVIERHPVIGEQILAGVPEMGEVARAVRHEHERWDGAGYPDGLSGEEIPLASRIVLVCDAWHAMTSDRPYRRALDHDTACTELREGAGTQFDPAATQALLQIVDDSPGPVAPVRRFRPRAVE